MFSNEKSMGYPVVQWMKSLQLIVKREFTTPWGICDLVGASLNPQNVSHRLRLGQKRPVNSITRAALLMQIPDTESGSSISMQELVDSFAPIISQEAAMAETDRLLRERFIIESSGQLQRVNGWMPLCDRLIAVELKLERVEEALLQARNNMAFADESYVALPYDLAHRVAEKSPRRASLDAGVGLLAVTPDDCEVVIAAKASPSTIDPVVQFYSAEKFWRLRPKDN